MHIAIDEAHIFHMHLIYNAKIIRVDTESTYLIDNLKNIEIIKQTADKYSMLIF